jgi:Transposase
MRWRITSAWPSTCAGSDRGPWWGSKLPATTIDRWPTFLYRQGFELRLIPTLALARTREAMHNSWDKNDPKDAQVILHLLKTGLTQTWHDPLVSGTHDAQELSKTHHQVALARTRVWHSLRNHYFQLYFPEIEHFIRSDSNDWLIRLLLQFSTPGAITALLCEEFVAQGSKLVGRKVHKTALLSNIYAAAQSSIALPVASDSPAIAMYRLVLEEYLALGRLRESIATQAETALANHPRSAAAHDHTRGGTDYCFDDFGRGRRSAPFRTLSPVPEVLRHESFDSTVGPLPRCQSPFKIWQRSASHRVLDGGAERGAHA